MSVRLFLDATAKRRSENGGLEWLSDWQVHSAHITAGAIGSIASGYETGPLYVPMPTGSGKTTGAIWGVVDFTKNYPNQRLCFMTPYKESVDRVYTDLAKHLGKDKVGHYHGDAFVQKEEELAKPVLIVTHQFVEHNHGRLDDRDLFVVDEAIYATGEATLKLQHFLEARSWATRNGVYIDEFNQLVDFTYSIDALLRKSTNKYISAPHLPAKEWAQVISEELKIDSHSQSVENREVMVSVQRFCEALLRGLVFLSKGSIDNEKYDPVFSAAVLGIPRMDKTVILSATGGMVYDIAGPFKQDEGSRDYWTPPSFKNLTLVQLSGPIPLGQYKTWSETQKKQQVIDYLDWLIASVPEQSIYLTMPKQVIEGCLRNYLGQPARGELNYPITLSKHDKKIQLSHHARSVGSNDFKDAEAVIYLWDNHLPQAVAIQRFHTLANKGITEEALEDANSGPLVGNYQRIREAQYIDNMMQQIGRGRVRSIDASACAGQMRAYVLTDPARFERLAVQYRDCVTTKLEYEDLTVSEPTNRLARIFSFLRQTDPNDHITFKEVEAAVGFDMRRYKNQLEGNWDLMMLGYSYVPGGRGRGNTGYFKRTNKD